MQHSKNSQGSTKTKRAGQAAKPDYDAMLEDSMNQDVDAAGELDSADETQEVSAASSARTTKTQASASGEEQKSVGAVIAQSLARESQESIDNVLSQVNGYIKTTKDYAVEKPGEAALIAVTAGMATYVLLGTAPGRKVFDAAAERFIPEITRWFSSNFSSVKH